DGKLTQEQADQMIQEMEQRSGFAAPDASGQNSQ
ncbi:MAG: hypothetical protein ACYC38_09420, partial [Eubacteriales bacterium]